MKRKLIRRDLKHLFGEPVSSLAKIVGLESLQITPELMEAVHEAADALLTMHGQSERQRGYLVGLPFTVRLVLCMWLNDAHLAAKLIRVAHLKA